MFNNVNRNYLKYAMNEFLDCDHKIYLTFVFQTLLDDLQRKLPAILQAKDGVKTMLDNQNPDNPEDCKLNCVPSFISL